MSFKTFTLFFIVGLLSSVFANQDEELKNIESALIELQEIKSESIPKILVYSKASGFTHKSIPTGVKALRALALKTKAFDPYFTNNAENFTTEKLKPYAGLIFNNTTRVEKAFVTVEQRKALLNFIKSGKGFCGFHGASDAGMPKWPEYTKMIGGCFDGHPWNAGGTWPFTVEDASHPLCKNFTSTTFQFSDEIYQYKGYDRKNLRVLVSLDAAKSGKMGKSPTNDYPVSWVKSYGKGRVFYTNFGHNKATWWTPYLLKHFLHGIRWSVGKIDGPVASLELASTK
jgi:type 1 glutamine amidotransferase